MARINVDDVSCASCQRPFEDIAVWREQEEEGYFSKTLHTVAKPLCRRCYAFADMQNADMQLVCNGCGLKAHVPEWLARRQVPWTPKANYDYTQWACSPRCRERQRRKDRRWKQKTCEACHQPFTATRIDARFCSAKCRQWHYRQQHLAA
jgi:hypothetical protein